MEQSLMVPVQGGELTVQTYSLLPDAPWLILLPDGPGQSSGYMSPLLELAGAVVNIAVWDPRGTNPPETGATPLDGDPSFELLVEDLHAVVTALEAEQVVILGHGFGSLVGLAWAAEHPDQATGLVLVQPRPVSLDEWVAARATFQRMAERAGLSAKDSSPGCRDGALNLVQTYFANAKPSDETAALRDQYAGCNSTAARQVVLSMGNYDLGGALTRIETPVWVIRGLATPFEGVGLNGLRDGLGQSLQAELPLSGCGAVPWLDCRDRFMPLLVGVIAEAVSQ